MTPKSSFSPEDLIQGKEQSSVAPDTNGHVVTTSTGTNAAPPPANGTTITSTNGACSVAAVVQVSNPGIDFKLRREIADRLEQEMHGTTIKWVSEVKGDCQCPNKGQHSGTSRSECALWIDGDFDTQKPDSWPTKKCAHSHCQGHPLIKQFNHELRSRICRAEQRLDKSTPNAYLISGYPELAEKYGDPLEQMWTQPKGGAAICKPVALNERFFASLLVREGNAKDPAVFDQEENKWFQYCLDGFYKHIKPEALHEPIGKLLLQAARECGTPGVDTKPLQFLLRSTKVLSPIVTKASGVACVTADFWEWPEHKIAVRNGVLDLNTRKLIEHSPDNHFRGVLPVDYVPGAQCPRWRKLIERLPEDDRDLLQRFVGQVLTGKNLAQKFLILSGIPATGKGTIARVLTRLAGPENVGKLRTEQLTGRFETGRLRHKTLIYAGDVPQDFLSNKGARVLKEITGGDPDSPEYKCSNATPPSIPIFASVLVTCNSKLRIRFEADKEAWRRRMILILFEGNGVAEDDQQVDLSDIFLAEEGSGILNWSLEGRDKFAADGFKLRLSDRQRQVRDALLEESESWTLFARECVEQMDDAEVLADEAYEQYVLWCHTRGWTPSTRQVFGTAFNRAIQDFFGITQSNDLGATETRRGWRNLKLRLSAVRGRRGRRDLLED